MCVRVYCSCCLVLASLSAGGSGRESTVIGSVRRTIRKSQVMGNNLQNEVLKTCTKGLFAVVSHF